MTNGSIGGESAALTVTREFNGQAVHQRRSDSYLDATAMCRAGGRKLSHYLENKTTTEFLTALSSDAGIPASLLVQSQKGVTAGRSAGDGQGTWVHPDVAVHLAQWCSPVFAVQVARWVRELMTTGHVSIARLADPVPTTAAEIKELIRQAIAESVALRPTLAPMTPGWTVQERLKQSGKPPLDRKRRAEIKRLANELILTKYHELPPRSDTSGGGSCVYFGHHLAELDEAIRLLFARWDEAERRKARAGLFAPRAS